MQRYFFHTEDGIRRPDMEGVELAGPMAARREAVRYLGQLIEDHPDDIWIDRRFQVTVTDDRHVVIAVLVLAVKDGPVAAEAAPQGPEAQSTDR